MTGRFSFRTRILALVLAVGVAPLALLGLWLTRATARSGENLLRERLVEAREDAAVEMGTRWIAVRSEIMDLAEMDGVRDALEQDARTGGGEVPLAVEQWIESRGELVRQVSLHDSAGGARWTLQGDQSTAPHSASTPVIAVTVPVQVAPLGPSVGTLSVELEPQALLGSITPGVAGMVVAAFDRSGISLIPLPVDPELLQQDRFRLAGDEWLAVRRPVRNPDLVLMAAAPLAPFTEPFEESARQGLVLMLMVLAVGLSLAWLLSSLLTRSLKTVAAAADDVARGELDRRVPIEGPEEVGRLASAFNSMTRSLRETMAELADQRALAAVGEFAASLAHEIRNPLTAIQVDLQMVEERLPLEDEQTRELQGRALAGLRRLDGTVAGALQAARAGRLQDRSVNVTLPLRAAAGAAEPAVRDAGGTLELDLEGAEGAEIRGDPRALEQVFLNVLLNGAQALEPGGLIRVNLRRDEAWVVVTVRDDGCGIAAEELTRVFDRLHTTRTDGTGLGLLIVRRLVEAHEGIVEIESEPGKGTIVRIRLPGAGQRAET